MRKPFWYGVATLVGSIIGVGIYGIPFAFQKAGFGVGFLFLVSLSGLILLSNLLYGEIILRTHTRHQFIGYTNKYLGTLARKINLWTFMLGAYGALIGIIIISGNFMANITSSFSHFTPASYSMIFVIVASFFIFLGRRTIAKLDFFVMIIVTVVVLLIGLIGFRYVDFHNYTFTMKDYWFLPFGVILFAMNGISGVPLAREVMVGDEDKLRRVLIVGTMIPAVLYLIFSLVVVGISGDSTTPDAISGLTSSLSSKIIFIGSLLGFLTSATIFLNLSIALKESFQQDFRFRHLWAWFLTIIPPYILFLSGIRNFIDIISLVGGLAISIEMVILIFLYVHARKNGDRVPEYSIKLPLPVLYLMMLIFAAGAVYTLVIK